MNPDKLNPVEAQKIQDAGVREIRDRVREEVSPERKEQIRQLSEMFSFALSNAVSRHELDGKATQERPKEVDDLLNAAKNFIEQLDRSAAFGLNLEAPNRGRMKDMTSTLLGAALVLGQNPDSSRTRNLDSDQIDSVVAFTQNVRERIASYDPATRTTKIDTQLVRSDLRSDF